MAEHLHEHAAHGGGGLFSETFDILTDPAHLIAEVVFSGLDVLIFGLLVPFVWSIARRKSRREFETLLDARLLAEHAAIDAEHGIPAHIEPPVGQMGAKDAGDAPSGAGDVGQVSRA